MIYQWRSGAQHNRLDAQVIGDRIEQLRQENEGKVTPVVVVDDARSPASPLHAVFEWDDEKAAESYRRWQAREVVGSLLVVEEREDDPEPITVRAFVSVEIGNGERAYTSIRSAMTDPNERSQVLAQARYELEAWRRRYATYVEFSEIISVIDQQLVGV